MASSISTLSPPPASDVLDIDDIHMDEAVAMATPVLKPPMLPSRRHPRPLTTSPGFIGYSFKVDGTQYTIREKSAVRKGGRPSHIWKYGSELSTPNLRYISWLCHLCWDNKRIMVMSASNTTRANKHLLEKHRIRGGKQTEEAEEEENSDTAQAVSVTRSVLQQQIHGAHQRPRQITIDRVILTLIQWIILAHIALSCVEMKAFQELLRMLNPVVFEYIYTSGKSVRSFILKEFHHRRLGVVDELQSARSKIHLSFDLWSSPNALSLCGVVAHYLTAGLQSRAILIGLRRVKGAHSGENIAEAILQLISEYGIAEKVGYFQADNAGNNDTCVQAILDVISPTTQAAHRRLRCYGHVINLAAKAFLFGDDPDAFELEIENLEKLKLEIRHERELLAQWRKKGPVGKLHNIVIWIRRTPQRRDSFLELSKDNGHIKRLYSYPTLNTSC